MDKINVSGAADVARDKSSAKFYPLATSYMDEVCNGDCHGMSVVSCGHTRGPVAKHGAKQIQTAVVGQAPQQKSFFLIPEGLRIAQSAWKPPTKEVLLPKGPTA